MQTTEVHVRNNNTDYSKSAASKASQPSPYIDVQKVFYHDMKNDDGQVMHQTSVDSRQVKQQPTINSPTFGDLKEGPENTGPAKDAAAQAAYAEGKDLIPTKEQVATHAQAS